MRVAPVLNCVMPLLPVPMPVVKLSRPGFGVKPQQAAASVVVVVGGAAVVVVGPAVVVVGGAAVVVVGPAVVVVGGAAVVVVGPAAVVVVVGAAVVVVVGGAAVVVVGPTAVVVVGVAVVVVGAAVVVVADTTVVVVVPGAPHVPAPHASQQLDTAPTHAVPPGGALHATARRLMLHWVSPWASVRQQVTKSFFPQVEFAAQCVTALRHAERSVPARIAAFARCDTQLT